MRDDIHAAQIPLPFAMASIGLCLSYLFPASVHPVLATTLGFAIGVAGIYFTGSLSSKENVPAGYFDGVVQRYLSSGNLITDQGLRIALDRAMRARMDLIRVLLEEDNTKFAHDIEFKLTFPSEVPSLGEKHGRR